MKKDLNLLSYIYIFVPELIEGTFSVRILCIRGHFILIHIQVAGVAEKILVVNIVDTAIAITARIFALRSCHFIFLLFGFDAPIISFFCSEINRNQ